MFNDTTSFKKIYIATGYTDLRQGILKLRVNLDSFDKDTLLWLCGRKVTKIKDFIWEDDDFCFIKDLRFIFLA